jgi:hypothetical protein
MHEEEYDDDFYMENVEKYGREPVDVFLSQDNISWPASENQVFTVFFNTQLILASIVGMFGCLSYRAKRLTAITFRVVSNYPGRAPSMQLFASSMGVLMGIPHKYIGILHLHYIRFMLMNLGLAIPPRNGRLFPQNKVSSGFYKYCLDLQKFEENNPLGVVKCPDAFPGIVFMVQPPGCTQPLSFSLFRTGKFNVMGAYTEQAMRYFIYILKILRRNRAEQNERSKHHRQILEVRKLLMANPNISMERARILINEAFDRVNIDSDDEDDIESAESYRRVQRRADENKKRRLESQPFPMLQTITYDLIYESAELGIYTAPPEEILLHGTKINKEFDIDEDIQNKDDDVEDTEEPNQDDEEDDDEVYAPVDKRHRT